MRALLVVNPSAAGVTGPRVRVAEGALRGILDLEVATTHDRGHATDLTAEAVERGAKAIIVFGGDGTVNEVLNGLVLASGTAHVSLGLLPGGGTNVLARNLGYPRDLVASTAHLLDLIESGSTRRIGLGLLEAGGTAGPIRRPFVCGTGVCLDGDTVRRVNVSGLRRRLGDLAYVYAGLQSFAALRRAGRPLLRVHGGETFVDAWWAVCANLDPFTYWGRHALHLAPDAGPGDRANVLAGLTASYLRTIRWLGQSLRGARHIHDSRLAYLPGLHEFTIEAEAPVHLQADGEYLGLADRLRVAAAAHVLTVYG